MMAWMNQVAQITLINLRNIPQPLGNVPQIDQRDLRDLIHPGHHGARPSCLDWAGCAFHAPLTLPSPPEGARVRSFLPERARGGGLSHLPASASTILRRWARSAGGSPTARASAAAIPTASAHVSPPTKRGGKRPPVDPLRTGNSAAAASLDFHARRWN